MAFRFRLLTILAPGVKVCRTHDGRALGRRHRGGEPKKIARARAVFRRRAFYQIRPALGSGESAGDNHEEAGKRIEAEEGNETGEDSPAVRLGPPWDTGLVEAVAALVDRAGACESWGPAREPARS